MFSMSNLSRRWRACALPMLLVLVAACADGLTAPVNQPRSVKSVSLEPAAVPLLEGANLTLVADVRDQDGLAYPESPITWSSSDTAVAIVSSGGLVSARRAGTTTVRATSGGQSDSVAVLVSAPPVASVTTDITALALDDGDARTIVANALDANGASLSRPFAWSSSNPAVATVDSAGRVVARAAGSAVVTVTSGGQQATVQVTVTGQLWSLTRALDLPLPATAFATTIIVNGTARDAIVQLTGGTLRFRNMRYELRLTGIAVSVGAAPVPMTFNSDGVLVYDLVNGGPMLHEGDEWVDREPRFRGRFLDDGQLELAWNPTPTAAVVPLVFVP